MSDFNWDDHPVVSKAPTQASGGGGFSWDDHPVVDAPVAQAPDQTDTGLVGKFSQAQSKALEILSKTHNPAADVLNLAYNTEPGQKALGYVGGLSRTGVATLAGQAGVDDWKKALVGEAPQSAEYLKRAGVTEGPSAQVPFGKQLFGKDTNVNLRDALGFGLDVATDPVAHAMGRAAPEMAATAGEMAGSAANTVASDVAPWAAKKIGKITASIPEETTARYIADPSTINSAPERSNFSDKILEMKKASEDKVAQAQSDLADAKGSLIDNKNDVRSGLQDQKFDLQNKVSDAQKAFDEKKQAFKEALKSNHLTSMANDVQGAVGDLKDQVVQGSKDAYDILGKSNGAVDVRPMLDVLHGHGEALRVNGVPTSASAGQSVQEIHAMHDRLLNMTNVTDGKLSLPQAKQILQGLDSDINYNKSAGAFAPQTDRAFSDLRRTIDQSVKGQSEPYRQKMEEVARKAQLLNKTSDLYGTPEKAISNLNGITSEKGQALHVPLLESLGKETGKDFSGSVKGYLLNDKILKTPSLFDQAIEDIPETRALAKAKSDLATVSDPAHPRAAIDQASEPLLNKIKQYQASLDAAKDAHAFFSGVTPDSITAKTKALSGANKYGAEIKFGDIDKAHGTDFEKQIRARNDLDQFSKVDGNGSRKTLLGTLLGTGVGWALDHPLVGAELGGIAGAAGDKFSGQAFKAALDKGMSVSAAAREFGPKAAAAAAPFGKVLPFAAAGGAEASALSASQSPQKGPNKWANDGASKLIDHSPDDKSLIQKAKGASNDDPKVKQLLIQASDLKPGSRAMDAVMTKLKSKLAEDE